MPLMSSSKESGTEDTQDLTEMEMPDNPEEHGEEKGAEQPGERRSDRGAVVSVTDILTCFNSAGEHASQDQGERPSTPTHLATTVF